MVVYNCLYSRKLITRNMSGAFGHLVFIDIMHNYLNFLKTNLLHFYGAIYNFLITIRNETFRDLQLQP